VKYRVQSSDELAAETIIRNRRDLLLRLEQHPSSASQISSMDPWERWHLEYGMQLEAVGFNEWELACLEHLVRETPADEGMPQSWLFEGGRYGDDRRLMLAFLSENARKTRLNRFISKVLKRGRQLGLSFKVERAADCSKTISTATTLFHKHAMVRPRNSR
jgi:hypothetical protein